MSRIIITNRSSASDVTVLRVVQEVILGGRVSKNNTCYCYLTSFHYPKVMVSAERTKAGTDTFVVFDDKLGDEVNVPKELKCHTL